MMIRMARVVGARPTVPHRATAAGSIRAMPTRALTDALPVLREGPVMRGAGPSTM